VAARKTVGEMTHVLVGNWRVGRKIPLNIYDGDRPVCQCHSEEDARRIVAAVNTQPQPDVQKILNALHVVRYYLQEADRQTAYGTEMDGYIRKAIECIEALPAPPSEKEKT
jgi:hypothetical protein